MRTDLFDYNLPKELIAQHSVEPRDSSRLLVLDRKTGRLEHERFFNLPRFLKKGDLLIFNDTKVFKARLSAELRGVEHELFLLRCLESASCTSRWEALIKRARRFHLGDAFSIGSLEAKLLSRDENSGSVEIEIKASQEQVLKFCDEHGRIPVPLYVREEPDRLEDYQTVYAREVGSVAAPTAGFHLTERLFHELDAMGVERAFVTLHVGVGTFQPVRSETLEEHKMHSEYAEISRLTARAVAQAKAEGRRVIAVGTTSVRALEGVALLRGCVEPFVGDVNLFITPGFKFKVIDALVTNFHLPKSTLLALVSAFAGREHVLIAYHEAVKKGYRFYSFGDAMLII
jgi:S-adenosylmethionine:tRNA ribosyltransferase-isomerase